MAKGGTTDTQFLPQREIPQFDGNLSKWKEYQKDGIIIIAKLTLEKKEGEACRMLSAGLTSDAWDEVEDHSAEDLIKAEAAKILIVRLRKRFKVDDRTELADDYEHCHKIKRFKGEPLFAYIS